LDNPQKFWFDPFIPKKQDFSHSRGFGNSQIISDLNFFDLKRKIGVFLLLAGQVVEMKAFLRCIAIVMELEKEKYGLKKTPKHRSRSSWKKLNHFMECPLTLGYSPAGNFYCTAGIAQLFSRKCLNGPQELHICTWGMIQSLVCFLPCSPLQFASTSDNPKAKLFESTPRSFEGRIFYFNPKIYYSLQAQTYSLTNLNTPVFPSIFTRKK
jgi:hypothetical protein